MSRAAIHFVLSSSEISIIFRRHVLKLSLGQRSVRHSTPYAFYVFGLASDADVGAAKVLTRLIAHTVDAGIGPFQAIFIVLPIALHPIGQRLTRWQFSRSCFARHQHNRNGRPQKLEPRSRELTK